MTPKAGNSGEYTELLARDGARSILGGDSALAALAALAETFLRRPGVRAEGSLRSAVRLSLCTLRLPLARSDSPRVGDARYSVED